MKTNNWLYGTEDVPSIPQDIIDKRLDLLNDRLRKLNELNYKVRNNELRHEVIRAIQFWQEINDV